MSHYQQVASCGIILDRNVKPGYQDEVCDVFSEADVTLLNV